MANEPTYPASIDIQNPINQDHPLNHGRVAWWLTLPGLEGGKYLYDLCGRSPGTLTNMTTTSSGWRGTTRPGGYGHLLFDGSNDVVNMTVPSQTTTGFTATAWFYTDPTLTGFRV